MGNSFGIIHLRGSACIDEHHPHDALRIERGIFTNEQTPGRVAHQHERSADPCLNYEFVQLRHNMVRIAQFLSRVAPSVARPVIRADSRHLREIRLNSPPGEKVVADAGFQQQGR
jgi:hypothetical protein